LLAKFGLEATVPNRLYFNSATSEYLTTSSSSSVLAPTYSTTYDNGVIVLGPTKPANCSSLDMDFNAIEGGTYTLEFWLTDLPQTVDLETLLSATLTTGSMPVTKFSVRSWDSAVGQPTDLDGSLSFVQSEAKSLVLNSGGAEVLDSEIVIDAFYGCVNDLTPYMTGDENLLLVKHAIPSSPLVISITIQDCLGQTIDAEGTLSLNVQKNEGN
jgi:hypothetical protein